MSTRLTKNDIPMVDSQSLKLVYAASSVDEKIVNYLSRSLKEKGYDSVTPAVLNFLGAMECGVNFGSDIARNLGVSRQMVAKTVRELCDVGYLQQLAAEGRQKQIIFTFRGEQLISDARHLLSEMDKILNQKFGRENFELTLSGLQSIEMVLTEFDKDE